MGFNFDSLPDIPKTGKKYKFFFSDHHIRCLLMEFGGIPQNKAILDSGKIVLFTASWTLDWTGDMTLPDDAVFLGEGYRLDDLPDDYVLGEINKLIDEPFEEIN